MLDKAPDSELLADQARHSTEEDSHRQLIRPDVFWFSAVCAFCAFYMCFSHFTQRGAQMQKLQVGESPDEWPNYRVADSVQEADDYVLPNGHYYSAPQTYTPHPQTYTSR